MSTLGESQDMVPQPLQPGARVGNYRLLGLLGKGGMGAVYEAMHLYIERRAAIKVLHAQLSQNSEFRTRFLNEARAVNRIQHPGLVEVFEFGLLDDGAAYIVMEFLQGESLDARIRRSPQGLGNLSLSIAADIAQAMVAAHQKGIVHRVPSRRQKPSRDRDLIWGEKTSGKRREIRHLGLVLDGSEQGRAFSGAHCA
jgi:hypothetical protein